MDALLEAVARLLGTFKDPVQVVLLLMCFALSFALYKLARFMMDSYEAQINSRVQLANALDGLTSIIKEVKDKM